MGRGSEAAPGPGSGARAVGRGRRVCRHRRRRRLCVGPGDAAGFYGLRPGGARRAGAGGARVLALGARLGAASQRPLVCHALGPKAGPAMDVLLAAVLLASAAAMASGAAAAMAEQFGWPRWLGAGVMMAASGGTVLGGVRGVVAALAAVAPLLVVSILLVSSFSLGAWPPGAGPAE